MESGVVERPDGIAIARVQVEISAYDHQRRFHVLSGVLQRLPELLHAEIVAPLAFEVKVVGGESLIVDQRLGNQSDSPSKPALEELDLRYIPTGHPEVRLRLKPYDPPIRERPWGKRRQAVVRRQDA